jgi:predicted fused transcriptional regulator/phosphomethylpyrimidine kinase
MKFIKFTLAAAIWFGSTCLLASMALDAMQWEQERQAAAAAEYRQQVDQELRVEDAVYRAGQ